MKASKMKTVALLAAATLLLPGCFIIRGFTFSNWFIPKRGKVIANLHLVPGATGIPKAYVFILVGFPSPDTDPSQLLVTGPRRFDTKGNFGGPLKMVRDDVLEGIVRDGEGCAILAGSFNDDIENSHWMLLRTKVPVRSGKKVDKTALTQIGIKPRSPGASGSLINFYSGLWRDDHAPVGPDVDDTFGCLSAVETNLFVGKPSTTALQSKAAKRLIDVLF